MKQVEGGEITVGCLFIRIVFFIGVLAAHNYYYNYITIIVVGYCF